MLARLTLYGLLAGLAASSLIFVAAAHAGGLYLGGFAVTNTGTAGAGANARADDASTAATNPAGMTRLKGTAVSLGAGLLSAYVEFDPSPATTMVGGDGGDQASVAPILSASFVHRASDNVRIGMNVVSFSGSVLDPGNGWVGRYFLQQIEFLTLTALPSVAVRINDRFSIGAGAILTYGTMDYTLAAPPPAGTARVNIDADDTAFGFTFGGPFELTERTRFGIVYATETKLTLSGDVSISGPIGAGAGIDLEIPFAETVRGSVYHELNDQWTLLGSFAWENWSTFANQFVSTEAGSTVIPRNWEDVWHFAVGVQYQATDHWLLQAGFSYDTSPVDAKDRTPDLPIDRQIRYAAGAEYALSETQTIGASFVFADLGDAEISRTSLSGEYDTNHFLFLGLYSKWRW